ncbi:MAG: hypothetical protein IJP33_01485 [Firmicutes bacterium]|nr:hypothetical protein [Bacillota bacterium]
MVFFQNQATLYSNNGATLSNIAAGEINETLSIDKTAVVDTYTADGTATFVITLNNTGTAAITGLTVTDNLGEYNFGGGPLYPLSYIEDSIRYYQNGILQPAPTVSANGELIIENITVPAGGNTMLIYAADITASAPLAAGSLIVNEVIAGNAEAQSTLTVEDYINLAINKDIEPDAVNENGSFSYIFTIYNYGNRAAAAEDGIRLVDEFDPVITIEEVTLDGDAFTNYTYVGGIFTSDTGAITVPAAAITQTPDGTWVTSPGTTTLIINGNL